MDALIEFAGLDTLLAIIVFVGSVIRAGQGEKVPALQGLISAFTPFFVVMCLIWLMQWLAGLVSLVIEPKALIAFGGLFAFLGNSWIIGLIRNGKAIEEGGALEGVISLLKSIITFKKQP